MNQKNNLPDSQSEFQDIWDLAQSYIPKEATSNDDSWAKLQAKLNNQNRIEQPEVTIQQPVMKVSYTKWISIAAAITVFAVSGLLFFNNQPKTITGKYSTQLNEAKTIQLEDGSSIVLAANSSVNYSISNEKREIQLTGKARFEVARDEKRPFTVQFNTSKVTVLGTGFDITSYDKDKQSVFVNHGKVKVESKNEEIILTQNLGASIQNGSISGYQLPENPIEWNEKMVRFKNADLSFVLQSLSDFTGKNFSAPNAGSNQKFSGSFDMNQKPEEISLILAKALNTEIFVR
jgi:ferric-dicitrate binding protein FerR (iron transport regulator)